MTSIPTRGVLLAATAALALTLGACGSDGDDDTDGTTTETGAASTSAAGTGTGTGSPAGPADSAPAGPFGPGCPADGTGIGAAGAPVVTAAGADPALSSLVHAATTANLVDTLNSTDDITVLAPANPAFEALPADILEPVLADSAQLTAVLTHHVLEGRLAPGELAGTHETLNGDEVTIAGAGESFTIDGTLSGTPASVICGNLQTANATVYVLDQVLAPAA